MWVSKGNGGKKTGETGLVAVAIDRDKSSQYALRWAVDNLLRRGRPVVLIHVVSGSSFSVGSSAIISRASPGTSPNCQQIDKQTWDLFLTFRCFCTRKDIRCLDVTLKDTDVAKALAEYANYAAIENLVLGSSRGGLLRKLKQSDIPTIVSRGAPDFCTVYVISRSKVASVCSASRPVPYTSPLQSHLDNLVRDKTNAGTTVDTPPRSSVSSKGEKPYRPQRDDWDIGRGKVAHMLTFRDLAGGEITPGVVDVVSRKHKYRSDRVSERLPFSDFPEVDTDISFVSSERTSVDRLSPLHYDCMDAIRTPRLSTSSDQSFGSLHYGLRTHDLSSLHDFSFISQESGRPSVSSQLNDDMEAEMRRLKLELKQTMQMYGEACKEAIVAKERERKQAVELHRWKIEEEKRLEEMGTPEEVALVLAERKKGSRTTYTGEQRGPNAENTEDISTSGFGRYRRYTIDEIEIATDSFSKSCKIGEGGYGPVFKCYLDHTRVAVKVLRPDAAQGRTQFQQEVEVLSCIRHPHIVLLVGACPEYGCLVYEYMASGSLDDRLFCRGNTPPLSWQVRFRIAAEVTTGLHFLHQTKPEPLVHRDLKPGNILLDRYFVSKIGDVGLARLVPPSVADHVTQYRMTSTAGTFCYIDPEYQQTGMLGVKSDVYSLGVVLLQLLTAKPPMGLAHHVNLCIEKGTFADTLDQSVPDWPVEEALSLAKIAVQCAEMRRKDRPDLGQVVLPGLARLRDFADDRTQPFMFYATSNPSPVHSETSISQDIVSDPMIEHSAASSSKLPSTPSTPIATASETK